MGSTMVNLPCIQRFCSMQASTESFQPFSLFSALLIIILQPFFVCQKARSCLDKRNRLDTNRNAKSGPNRVLHLDLLHPTSRENSEDVSLNPQSLEIPEELLVFDILLKNIQIET